MHYEPKKIVNISQDSDGAYAFSVVTSNPATRLMLMSLAQVFQLTAHEWPEQIDFSHAQEKVAQAAAQSMDALTEFDPPLAQLEAPPVDARLDGMLIQAEELAGRFCTADGVMILEAALLKILGIPQGLVFYDPNPSQGSGAMPMPAYELSGMSHLLGLHWVNQKTIFNLHAELADNTQL